MRRLLLFALKACVSIVLLAVALRAVDFSAVWERLSDLSPSWTVLVIAVFAVQIVAQAVRWRDIASAAGAAIQLRPAIRISFIAAFFSQTLPSIIGSDAARIWLLARTNNSGWKSATYAVLLDRVVGVFFLAVLVVTALPWTYAFIQSAVGRLAITAIGAAGVAGGFVFASLSLGKGGPLEKFWPTRHLVAAADVLVRICRTPRIALRIASLSIAIHLMTVFVAWAAARAIGAPLDLLLALCLMPPVVLLSAIPISIAGWGVREALMITAFGLAGLNAGDALVISIILGAANFIVGASGGLLWMMERNREAKPPSAADNPLMSAGSRPRSG